MQINDRERDTILAGLRLLQSEVVLVPLSIVEISTNGHAHPPLTHAEIDELCEKLNIDYSEVAHT